MESGHVPARLRERARLLIPSREPAPLARRLGSFLGGQVTVLCRRILLASLAVLAAGLLALVPSGTQGDAVAFFRALAPLASAVGIALVYNDRELGASELLNTLPTSPRLVLLARLAIVFSTNALVVWLLILALGRRGVPLSVLLSQWLGPMAFLSTLALLVAVLSDATAGASVAGGAWLLLGTGPRFAADLGSLALAQVAMALRQPAVIWGLVAVNVFLALWLAGTPRLAPRQTFSDR